MTTIRIPFGKHRGTPLAEMQAGYLTWMLKTAAGSPEGVLGRFVADNESAIRDVINGAPARTAGKAPIIQLNDGQTEAVQMLLGALYDGGEPYARLEGGAGYGKSFTVYELARRAMRMGITVRACATSYVATQVLAKQLAPLGCEVRTIASMLRLAKVEFEDQEDYITSEKTGQRLVELLDQGQLLIVDEYSMVADELGCELMHGAASMGGKLLAVGDLKQLPPVKQSTDSVLSSIPVSYTLTQPMRYSADSDLYALEQLVRHNPHIFPEAKWDSTEVVTHSDLGDLLRGFVADSQAHPSDDNRMLFFRRTDVIAANQAIRAQLHGERKALVSAIVDDERLMVMNTADVDLGQEKPTRFYSGTTYMVEHVCETEYQGIPCYLVKLHEGPVVKVVFANGTDHVDASRLGADAYVKRLHQLRDEALETGSWAAWRAFKNSFLQVGYNYAMTVHRCQGQTVDRVYFDPAALKAGAMSDKLLYVAATRAKKQAHMVDPK